MPVAAVPRGGEGSLGWPDWLLHVQKDGGSVHSSGFSEVLFQITDMQDYPETPRMGFMETVPFPPWPRDRGGP